MQPELFEILKELQILVKIDKKKHTKDIIVKNEI